LGAIRAPSWVLIDADTGRILAGRDPRRRLFPASTTKTMTALVAIESGRLNDIVTIGPNPPKTGESSIYLQQGEQFTLRDLVRAAMIKSANDSCVAIAEGVAGTVPAFVEKMNRRAKEVGALDTHFVNPHGLHDPNHYTTALDLARIARAAAKYPFFNETVRTLRTTIHGNEKLGPVRVLLNRNRLLQRWKESDGIKTGYTRQAGRCLVASATRVVQTPSGPYNFRLISVVLHSPDSWTDSANILRNEGFAKYHPMKVSKANQSFGTINVAGGAFSAEAITPRDIGLPLRHDEQGAQKPQVRFFELKAPLRAGQPVGSITFFGAGRRLAETPLVAREAVPIAFSARVLPPAARYLPSHPPLRWTILGGISLGLATLLTVLKIRAQRPRADRTNHERTNIKTRPAHISPDARSESTKRTAQRNTQSPARATVAIGGQRVGGESLSDATLIGSPLIGSPPSDAAVGDASLWGDPVWEEPRRPTARVRKSHLRNQKGTGARGTTVNGTPLDGTPEEGLVQSGSSQAEHPLNRKRAENAARFARERAERARALRGQASNSTPEHNAPKYNATDSFNPE
jgi:D-alanyl-D-alanine carboxypeptidase (penicillin-binding protein 5/6)